MESKSKTGDKRFLSLITISVLKNYFKFSFVSILFAMIFTSCEEEFIPEISTDPTEIVVEGYIEAGSESMPPYLLLTRSLPFFAEVNLNKLDSLYVHDAYVTVYDGEKTVALTEVCWNDFSAEEQELLKQILIDLGLGIVQNIPLSFCVYIDLDFEMTGEVGKTYDLKIEVDGQTLTASTTIPEPVPLEYIKFQKPPGNIADTLLEMRSFIEDPVDEMNFYRYFTAVNSEALMAPFGSVIEDQIFNGQAFEFPLSKAESPNEEINTGKYGFYIRGDSVTLKWSSIDQDHFDFWNTLEFNRINQGPFSSYTKVDFNINGGIGIWGGYSSIIYKVLVTE